MFTLQREGKRERECCPLTLAGILHQLGLGSEHVQNRGGLLTQQHTLNPQLVAEHKQGQYDFSLKAMDICLG